MVVVVGVAVDVVVEMIVKWLWSSSGCVSGAAMVVVVVMFVVVDWWL